jgi:malonate transporter and related proteins
VLSNFFEIFLLISPVFILIILGNILRRIRVPDLSFWDVNDKLVYWVLIPALLFHHISQINFSSSMFYSYGVVILSGLFIVTIVAITLGKLLGYSAESWSSILQGAARHNAFIALAIAGSLFGDAGLAVGAVFMLLYVPSINIVVISIMVSNLNQPGQTDSKKGIANIFVELIKNPFILAMIVGLIFSLIDSEKIVIIHETSGLLGSAALPIMLLTIGAKIKVRDLALKIKPILISNSLKLIAFPIIAYFVAKFMELSQLEVIVAVIFASVPTAASSHALAKQFGGDEQLMTSIVTTQVALSFITIPVILAVIS